jgi:hypothetical protein
MKEIKSSTSFPNNKGILLLWILFISMVGVHLFWITKAAGDGKFFLLHEDEVIYYCSAKLFSSTNSLQAESCIDENVSRKGSMNWYGPGYNFVYGSIFKITGIHPAVFPWFHFGLAMGMLGLIFLLPITLELRLLAAIGLSVTQQFCVYIYTFFPETLVLFLATVLTLLLILCFYSQDEKRKRSYLIAFIVCTFLFMLCRITFIFWLAGLIGLSTNRKSLITNICIFSGGVILSLIYMKLFVAPPWAGEMHKIDLLYQGELVDFVIQSWTAFVNNLRAVFVGRTSAVTMLMVLILTAAIAFYLTRHKLILAALLIAFFLLATMFAYYSVNHFYFVKQTAMLIPLLLVCLLAAVNSKVVRFGLVITLLLVFPSPFKKTNEAIEVGRGGYEHYTKNDALEKAFSTIPDNIQNQSTLILWCYREYDYGYSAQALLPFSTREKNPIMYTTNIVDPNADPETKFMRHNKLKVDYILSRYPVMWPNLEQVHETEFYHLYKLLD